MKIATHYRANIRVFDKPINITTQGIENSLFWEVAGDAFFDKKESEFTIINVNLSSLIQYVLTIDNQIHPHIEDELKRYSDGGFPPIKFAYDEELKANIFKIDFNESVVFLVAGDLFKESESVYYMIGKMTFCNTLNFRFYAQFIR